MSKEEYEVISHDHSNYHLFLVNLLYRTPHIHKDFELGLILDGELILSSAGHKYVLHQNDIFLMNPFQSHGLEGAHPCSILSLQVSASFFSSYFPQIENMEFDIDTIPFSDDPGYSGRLCQELLLLAEEYFRKERFYELHCASQINRIFFDLFQRESHHLVSEKEKQSSRIIEKRMHHIIRYIEEHYTEKLLLSDIAGQEELDLYYLSHFFKDSFGMTFQHYLTRIRCERARQLLLLSDYNLLDICMSCGFSDPKYFNKGFLEQYGCTPKEYRSHFYNARLEQQQKSMLTTQEFLSDTASLIALEKISFS